jgi:hypothetical protein
MRGQHRCNTTRQFSVGRSHRQTIRLGLRRRLDSHQHRQSARRRHKLTGAHTVRRIRIDAAALGQSRRANQQHAKFARNRSSRLQNLLIRQTRPPRTWPTRRRTASDPPASGVQNLVGTSGERSENASPPTRTAISGASPNGFSAATPDHVCTAWLVAATDVAAAAGVPIATACRSPPAQTRTSRSPPPTCCRGTSSACRCRPQTST